MKLQIGINDSEEKETILSCRAVSIRERVLRFLLGEKQRLMILVPGENVAEVTITEEGKNNDKLTYASKV